MSEAKKKTEVYFENGICDNSKLANLTSVVFQKDITFLSPLPDHIEEIEFHCYYDKPIAPGILPKQLKVLDLGWYFNQKITDEMLPEPLEVLRVGYWFNQPLYLSPRNLKRIEVRQSYKHLVSPEILHLMTPEYQANYKMIKKNHELRPEDCTVLDAKWFSSDVLEEFLKSNVEQLSLESDPEPEPEPEPKAEVATATEEEKEAEAEEEEEEEEEKEKQNPEEEDESLKVWKKMEKEETNPTLRAIIRAFCNHFTDSSYSPGDLKVFVNEKGQTVIEVRYSYWCHNHCIYVGQDGMFYRTLWGHISIPKPYQYYTDDTVVGPFSLSSLLEHLPD